MSQPDDYLERILTSRVYDVAIESPLDVAHNLSRRLNNQILLKREDLQPVFSFKCRGAYNKMAKLTHGPAGARRGGGVGRQPCAGGGAGGAKTRCDGHHRDAGDHAEDQGRRGGGARRAGDPARRQLRRSLRPRHPTGQGGKGDLRSSLRRPRRDRRAGHGGDGTAAPASGPDPLGLHPGRRRRADRRHGGLHQAAAAGNQDRRRRTRGCRRDGAFAVQGQAHHAAARRHFCRRRGGEEGRQGNLPAGAAVCRRNHPRQQRRHLRGDQGRVRGHPFDPGAGRRAVRLPA